MDPEILAAWEEGAREFNSQRFWEAHHGWEESWRKLAEPRTREWTQAMIQACGVFHHLERGKREPALRLAARMLEHIEAVRAAAGGPPATRIDIPGLEELIREIAASGKAPGGTPASEWLARAKKLRSRVVRG